MCAFCGTHRADLAQRQLEVRRVAEEYTLLKALYLSSGNASSESVPVDNALVVFCIDVSGSSKPLHPTLVALVVNCCLITSGAQAES